MMQARQRALPLQDQRAPYMFAVPPEQHKQDNEIYHNKARARVGKIVPRHPRALPGSKKRL